MLDQIAGWVIDVIAFVALVETKIFEAMVYSIFHVWPLAIMIGLGGLLWLLSRPKKEI